MYNKTARRKFEKETRNCEQMKKWKIALVAFHIPDFTETFMERLILVFQKLGHEVVLFIPNRQKISGFDLCEVNMGLTTGFTGIRPVLKAAGTILKLFCFYPGRLLRFWRNEKRLGRKTTETLKNIYLNAHFLVSDIDHIHFFYLFNGIGKESVIPALGIKSSASVRGDDVLVYPETHPDCYKHLAPNLAAIHCISSYMEFMLSKFGMGQKKTFISGGSIGGRNLQKPEPKEESRNPVVLLTVARLTKQKGLETSIRAVARLIDQNPETRLVYHIIGEGELRKPLSELIQTLEMETHIFLEGKKSHEEVLKQMQEVTVYVQPSRWEGLCNATLEAMVSGRPVIVSNIRPFSEYIQEGINGYFFEEGDADSLAGKIQQVLRMSSEQRRATGKKAFDTIEQKFSLAQHIKCMEEMIIFLQKN